MNVLDALRDEVALAHAQGVPLARVRVCRSGIRGSLATVPVLNTGGSGDAPPAFAMEVLMHPADWYDLMAGSSPREALDLLDWRDDGTMTVFGLEVMQA